MEPELNVTNERIDDIPVLLEQMNRLKLAELLDEHFPTHGHWVGASLGQVTVTWLSHILSEGDHRLSYVEEWVAQRTHSLGQMVGQPVRVLDYSDDRLAQILAQLSQDEQWAGFETALGQRVLRVYPILKPERVRMDSTTVSGHWQIREGGLFQYGHSKDHRPDLPQLKVMLSTLDPLGLPLATEVVAGQRADDPLYEPAIEAVRETLKQPGLLYVGDAKMAALNTRLKLVEGEDYYLCPLPQVQLSEESLGEYLEPVWKQEQELTRIERERADGEVVTIATGFEIEQFIEEKREERSVSWSERRLVVRSQQQAKRQRQRLQERLAQSKQALAALTEPKRGRQRPETLPELEEAAQAILKQYRVEGLLELKSDETVTERQVRAYGDRPARIEIERELSLTVTVNQKAVDNQCRRFGWRVYATNASQEQLPLAEAILAYRDQYIQERSFARLKNKPLSLSPMYLHRDDHATGLVRLMSLALRVLTLLQFTVRHRLAAEEESLAGLYPGNPKRETDRPTAERLLKAFDNITLTLIHQAHQVLSVISSLSALQQRILELLDFPNYIYTRFNATFQIPP